METLSLQTFRQMILTGAKKLVTIEKELNSINVFPVADGDTGSNMAYLMRMIIRELAVQSEQGLNRIKLACLRGSRGNSGMILSQFIITMCNYVQHHEKVSLLQFVEMSEQSVMRAIEVVKNPLEGTIISVMRDWLSSLKAGTKHITSLEKLLEESHNDALHSLEKTKQQIELLQKHNVVDAGAKGFCYFIQGFVEGIRFKELTTRSATNYIAKEFEEIEMEHRHTAPEKLNYRYCSEFLFEHCQHYELLKENMNALGDSIIFVGDQEVGKLHIHTEVPHQVAELLSRHSTIVFQKVDDMKRQQEAIYECQSNIALVVDSACDIPDELMDEYQIHLIPLTVTVDDSYFLDKRTILPESIYGHVRAGDKTIRTSLPSGEMINVLYSRLLEQYDYVVSIHLSNKLSGTYSACVQAANELDSDRIIVFDSKTLSGAYGLFVLEIAKFINEKQFDLHDDKKQLIVKELMKQSDKQEILVTVPSLTSMVNSGRVSPMMGKFARWLNIKPLVTLDKDGASKLLRPSMLRRSNLPKLLKQTTEIHRLNPIEKYVVLFTDQDDDIPQLIREMTRITGKLPEYVTTVSSVIGIYAGTGAYSIAMTLTNTNERGYII